MNMHLLKLMAGKLLLKSINIDKIEIKSFHKKLIGIIFLKIILMTLFSSGYSNDLFKPFIQYYINNTGNPWEHFDYLKETNKFPYPPLMLYILTVFYWPVHFLNSQNILIENFLFKLPLLISDIFILFILIRSFPNRENKIILVYFLSPILIYASYIHSQLDIIPTALLFWSVILLIKKKGLQASIIFGLALSTKFHVLAALPLMAIYQYRNSNIQNVFYLITIPFVIYFSFSMPYILSESYQKLVLFNLEQSYLTQVFFSINKLELYVAPLAVMIICMRFSFYKKVNSDLFLSYLGLLFSVFVLLIPPGPAWYLWFLPFIMVYLLKHSQDNKGTNLIIISLSVIYLIYFNLFYNKDNIPNLQFINSVIEFEINNNTIQNSIYTLLWCLLLAIIYSNFKYSIRSNSVYKKNEGAFVIGIGGDSGSGKSTILSDLKLIFGNKLLEIEGDGDHKWERGSNNWELFTHLDPKANFLHRQAEDIFKLKNYKIINRSDYDHNFGTFTKKVRKIPNDYLIISGLHTFYLPKLRKLIDLKIYLNTDDKLRINWKIKRDMNERGSNYDKLIEQIEKRNDDAIKYIHPQKNYADLVITYSSENNFNPFEIKVEPKTTLMLQFDSNINTDKILEQFDVFNIKYTWNYSEDIKTDRKSVV